MSTGFATPNGTPVIGGAPPQSFGMPAGDGRPMDPNVGQRQGVPTLNLQPNQPQFQQPQFQQPAQPQYQPQFQQQPAFPQQPAFQAAPQAPQFQQQQPQPFIPGGTVMPPQVPQQPAAPTPQPQQYGTPQQQAPGFAFNDGLQLAGPVGGVQPPRPAAPQAPQQPGQSVQPAQQPGMPQQPVAPQGSTVLVQQLAAMGVPTQGYRSDSELLADLASGANEIGQLRQMANLGYRFLEQQGQGGQTPGQPAGTQQHVAQQPGQQPATQRQATQQPEWRPEWSSQVVLDQQSGRYVAADQYSNPLIVQRANEMLAWRRARSESLLNDPVTFLEQEGLGQKFEQLSTKVKQDILNEIRTQQAAMEGEQILTSYINSRLGDFFETVPDGRGGQQLAQSPITGKPIMTPRGQAASRYAEQFRASFRQTYGREPLPQDTVNHVQLSLSRDEASGVYGVPQFTQQPGMQPQQPQSFMPQHPAQFGQPQFAQQFPTGQFQPQFQQPQQMNPWQANAWQKDQFANPQRNQAIAAAQWSPTAMGTFAASAANPTLPQDGRLDFTAMLRQGASARGINM